MSFLAFRRDWRKWRELRHLLKPQSQATPSKPKNPSTMASAAALRVVASASSSSSYILSHAISSRSTSVIAAASPYYLLGRSSSSSAATAPNTNSANPNASSTTTTTTTNASSQQQPSYLTGPTTHFGYKNISIHEKESRVKHVFEKVASNYDIMNDFMSGGLHRYWKDELLRMTGVKAMAKAVRRRQHSSSFSSSSDQNSKDGSHLSTNTLSILDVAGGTGDVAFRFIDAAECVERSKSSGKDEISVTVCDINPEMLRVGEMRAREKYGEALLHDNNNNNDASSLSSSYSSSALRFVEGNAQHLPFESDSFDLYTIAFGLRNVTDVDAALQDAYRVLKPGGRYLCLEFSHVPNVPLSKLYDVYSFNVIPQLGEWVAQDRHSYQYLVESIRKFCTQEELVRRMENAGFEGVKYTNMTGGIVAIHEGWKPL
jgi:ubiquinone/menaquinone biosynthesis C-methylase UbiE